MVFRAPFTAVKTWFLAASITLKRVGVPAQILMVLVFLSSGESSYTAGAVLPVSDGK